MLLLFLNLLDIIIKFIIDEGDSFKCPKEKKNCCIYKLTNKINGKIYIGQTVDYHRRMNEYKNRKSSKEKSSKYGIMEKVEKYGFENFTSEIIRECSRDELTYYEMFYIDKFKSYLKKMRL